MIIVFIRSILFYRAYIYYNYCGLLTMQYAIDPQKVNFNHYGS